MNTPSVQRDDFSRQVLDFPAIVELIRQFLSGPISEPRLASLAPRTDVGSIRRDLERVKEAWDLLRESPRPSLDALRDPRPVLEKLQVQGVSLAALEILALVDLARAARDVGRRFAKSPLIRLGELAAGLADFRDLVAELDGKILPDGSLDSSASPALARIRRSIERLRREVESSLEKLVHRLGKDGILQDAVVTIRNDRLVIPVRAEEKRRVPGVVHGTSSSGATVYLEPLETVPLNNELVELQDQEFAETQRILALFSGILRGRQQDLASATDILSEIDLAFAKAEFARRYDCCLPEFSQEQAVFLRDARHPLLQRTLEAQGRQSVPLTLELKRPKTLMVISGPNTGGKTVALKAIGTVVLMAQSALPVPASEVRLPIFGRVLADIGDPQSIESSLSTFSGHLLNMQSMLERAEQDDLVLLDEIVSSTEPHEGAALAVAILDHFRQIGAMTFVTTHLGRLKAFAAETPEAVNAAMEFDEATLQPTYRLLVGLPGASSALSVAARLGLEPSVVEKARALLDPAERETAELISGLHQQQQALENQRRALEQSQKELEKRRAELERQFQQERRAKLKELDARLERTVRQVDESFESFAAELRNQAEAAKLAKKIERKSAALKARARELWNAEALEALGVSVSPEAPETFSSSPLAVGDRVRVDPISTPGTVVALAGQDDVEVEVGRLRMRVAKKAVRALERGEEPAGKSGRQPGTVVERSGHAPAEINVIGCTAEEAREQVDKFLDQAYVAGRFRLRVVHGHGKGILRKALQEMFASHPHVEKFYPAPQQEGGAGATVVELKI